MSPSLAPVALFVYSRPEHTRRTLEALQRNTCARDTDLIVFADGSKGVRESEICAVNEVRALVRSYRPCFKSLELVERATNLGLAHNIISGVTSVCNESGRVIVLEDDIVTSPYFLRFMNDALTMYSEAPRVFAISGCTYPVDLEDLVDDTFFLRIPLCWGWATWSDKWKNFEKNLDAVPLTSKELVRYVNFDNEQDYFGQAIANYRGKLNTWFIFWYLTLARHRAVALFPKRSLVENIGMDGTGENCGRNTIFRQDAARAPVSLTQLEPTESLFALEQHKKFFRGARISLRAKFSAAALKWGVRYRWG